MIKQLDMVKTIVSIIVFWSVSIPLVWTQPSLLDSLIQVANQVEQVEAKARLLHQISVLAYEQNHINALAHAEQSLAWAKRYELHQMTIKAHLQLVDVLAKKQAFDGAKEYLVMAESMLAQQSYPEEQVQYGASQGHLYIMERNYKEAAVVLKNSYEAYLNLPQPNQTLRRTLLKRLVYAYNKERNEEAAVQYLVEWLQLRTAKDSTIVYNHWGTILARQQQFEEALVFYEKSLGLATSHQEHNLEGNILLDIGNAYFGKKHWTKAIYYYTLSAEIKERLGDEARLAALHNNIAGIYHHQGYYDKSLEYYQKNENYYKKRQDSVQLAVVWANMGSVMISQGKYEDGIELVRAAIPILNTTQQYERVLLIAHLNLGLAYVQINNYPLAMQYLQFAEEAAIDQEDNSSLMTISNLYGFCFFKLERYNLAIEYYQKALQLGQDLDDLDEQATALSGLHKVEQARQNYQAALNYLEQYQIIHDSAQTLQTDERLLDLQEKYNSEQKEKEIATLNIKNQNAELENQLQKRQLHSLITTASLVGLVLLLLAGFLAYRQRQQKTLLAQTKALHNEKVNQLIDKQELQTLDAVLEAQQEERKTLAKDIHDTLGSFLATLKYQHEAGKDAASDPTQYQIMETLIDQACSEVRAISHQMATGEGVNFELTHALEQLVLRIKNTQQFDIDFQHFGEGEGLSQKEELLIYRIVQELLSNILKHASATQASVQLNQGEAEWTVVVEDNGKGFDHKKPLNEGLGLNSVAERIQQLNGQLNVDSMPGRGTTVIVTLPIYQS